MHNFDEVGKIVGKMLGLEWGSRLGSFVGKYDGSTEGIIDGIREVGPKDGTNEEGKIDALFDGAKDGRFVFKHEGGNVDCALGLKLEGETVCVVIVGSILGETEGSLEGNIVGS
jgi:hypothetical protein